MRPVRGFRFRQNRHGRVVGMQPMRGEHMRLHKIVKRLERESRRADQIAERGQAEINAFMGITVRQAVQAAYACRTSHGRSSPTGTARQSRAEWHGTARASG